MHKLNIKTKFTFGDKVKFNSELQGCKGQGTVFAITVSEDMDVDYMIQFTDGGDGVLQPGVLEEEMTLIK